MTTFELNTIDSVNLLKLGKVFAEEAGTCLLYSGGDLDSATKSFLFLFPFDQFEIRNEKDPWTLLKSKITLNDSWVGFLSYEMGDETVEVVANPIPNAYFQKSAFRLILDHKTGVSTVLIQQQALPLLSDHAKKWLQKLSDKAFLGSFIQELPEIEVPTSESLLVSKSLESLESYVNKVEDIQEMIADGIVYQVNLSHELEFIGERNPYLIFHQLAKINPAPFSAYFNFKNFTIVSSSPERFLQKANDVLETRPIKGTMPRGKNIAQDFKNKEKLLNSEKDLAELLMITDLMRNDLGQISCPGSVKALKISHLEAYTNVYHLLSIIQSIPVPSLHSVDLIQACFPGGSITGCPKRMAMKVIKKFEKRNRGIYTGSIGYFDENSGFDFNIAIRTLVFYQNKINIQLGGAITSDSLAKDEYDETIHKGESIFLSLT